MLAAGCGKGSDSQPMAPPAEVTTTSAVAPTIAPQGSNASGACRLVTTAEAEKAVGAPIGTPTARSVPPENGLGLEMCT